MTTSIPYAWLKELPRDLKDAQIGNFFGSPPPFPWEQLSAVLGKLFGIEQLAIVPGKWLLHPGNKLLSGLGDHPAALHIDVAPLTGTLCYLLPENDLSKLISILLTRETSKKLVIDKEYQQGFYRFLALEIMEIFNKLDYEKGLCPHLLSRQELPTKESFCQDITIQIEGQTFHGRLIISEELRQSWKERFAERELSASLPKSLAEKIGIEISFQGGYTEMRLSEWRKVNLGDCLILDQCTLQPQEDKGLVTLSLNQRPLFIAQIKGSNVKILEYSLQSEEPNSMSNSDDSDFDDFDMDFDEEITSEQGTEKAARQPPPLPRQATAQIKPVSSSTKPLQIEDLMVNVVVEVARTNISIQTLAELEPGSLLELAVHPEDGVDLTINGQLVAKGELLKIGEVLGVRILDKG